MTQKASIAALARSAKREDSSQRKALTKDSFQNFAARMGVGTDNLTSYSTYGFNPISRVRILLEWIHRGSWLGGVAVDAVGDDMTRAGVKITGEVKPKELARIEEVATTLKVWNEIRDNICWARLYGGAITVYLIDGQSMKTPLRIETVSKGQFKGLVTLDRWMVEPSLNDLITDFGPDLGMPKFYTVNANAPALVGQKIHYSRVIRSDGIRLPFNQRMTENLWGISVYERIYDRMIAYDSATTGMAQSVYKSYLRTVGMKDLRENIAAGGGALDGVVQYIQMMAKFQSIEGITMLDAEDTMTEGGAQNFAGLRDCLMAIGEQLAGGIGMPLVRMFGMSPAGFSSGESDLRSWYDTVNKEQNSKYKIPVTNIYKMIAQSEEINVPEGFGIDFNPLWQLTEETKASIASQVTTFVSQAREQGVVKPELALKELKQSSEVTGYWSNITDKDIKDAEEEGPPMPNDAETAEAAKGVAPGEKPVPPTPKKPGGGSKDSASTVAELARLYDLHVVIENPAGSIRRGIGWESFMPDDYGYIRRFAGADGDAIDCFVGKDARAQNAYVIDQRDLRTGLFDEHKIMLGYPTAGAAVETYLLAYDDGDGNPDRIMSVTALTMPELKAWLVDGAADVPCAATHDAKFKESEHPRKNNGEFGSGTGQGSTVRKFTTSRAAYKLLDSTEAAGGTWAAGGCYILASALQKKYGGELQVVKDNHGVVHHVVLALPNGEYMDADGAADKEALLSRMRNDEGVVAPQLGPLKDDEVDSEIPRPTKESTEAILKALSTHDAATIDFAEAAVKRGKTKPGTNAGSFAKTAGKATPAPPKIPQPRVKMTEAQSTKNIAQLIKTGDQIEFASEAVMDRVAAKDKERGFDWEKGAHRYMVAAPEDRSKWPAHCLRIPPDAKNITLCVNPDSALIGAYDPSNGGSRKTLYKPEYLAAGKKASLAPLRQLIKDEPAIDAALKKAVASKRPAALLYASAMWDLALRSGDEAVQAGMKNRKTGEIVGGGDSTFGARGILGKHIRVRQDGVYIMMPGKKRAEIDLRVDDHYAAEYKKRKEKAGSNGKIFADVSYSGLRNWMATVKLGDHTLGDYIPHDVRKLRATKEAQRAIKEMKLPLNPKQWKEAHDKVLARVGKLLVDTPNATRAYIDPDVWKPWKQHEDTKKITAIKKLWGVADE